MSSKRGFVYVLENEFMPDVYKIGCTERSPHERAAELSAPSGVPAPFRVLCYIEVEDFQIVEQQAHNWMAAYRISESREFFLRGLRPIMQFMWHHPARLAFCDATQDKLGCSAILKALDRADYIGLDDPWNPPAKPEQPTIRLVANGEAKAPFGDDDMPF